MADEKFTIVLKKSPDYRIYPGNVVYGGPTPDLEGVLISFCVDHAPFPNYLQHPILEGRVDISKIVDQAIAGNLERELLCGISMSLHQAKALQTWLNTMIETIERQRGG